jgi:anti-sigma B factor antagonist
VSKLEFQRESVGAPGVVRVVGEIDLATAPQLRTLLGELIDAGAAQVVLDCSGLEFLDSSGIGVLVAARSRLGDDGALVLVAPPAHVRKVLDITGVVGHLTVR